MGLDITAYEHIDASTTALHDTPEGNAAELRGEPFLNCEPGPMGQSDGLVSGFYRATGLRIHFSAGSYHGYGDFRETLAKMVGKVPECVWAERPAQQFPFAELINFSDCDGTIGPKTSAKLAQDFADHQTKADAIGGHFVTLYNEFRTAFRLACSAGDGAVAFT